MLLAGSCEKETLEQRPLKRINFKRLDSSTAQIILLVISYVFSLLGLTAALEVENSFLQLSFCWSPTAGAAAVQGGQSSLSGLCTTDRGGGGFLTLPSMHNWYWAWEIRYNLVIVSAAAPPGSEHNHICHRLSLQHNAGGRKLEGERSRRSGTLQGDIFYKVSNAFCPP